MKVPRQYVKKWIMMDVEGHPMLVQLFKDMTNKELAQALSHFTEREDFEYCEELIAEAELRGITLTTKHNEQRKRSH